MPIEGFKPKDMVGIPWRVAFALQADGWYLRRDIIWHKPNPMPESVKDRPTTAHEYIFLMSKAERYYYDSEAVKEPYQYGRDHHRNMDIPPESHVPGAPIHKGLRRIGLDKKTELGGRNLRSVWTVPTAPYKGAHFATFPPDLIVPCVLAGCPPSGTVLDPFAGTGTTGLVAERFERKAVLNDLNDKYLKLMKQRNGQRSLLALASETGKEKCQGWKG
jgi:site-specific DNA-methyltransferase (adenine-specific)